MKIALGSDHRGDDAVRRLAPALRDAGHEVILVGPCDGASRDYPDEAWLVGQAVVRRAADVGVLVCGSGNGVCIAANKIAGIRAAIGYSTHAAEMARRHNNANVICFSGDTMDYDTIEQGVNAFLAAEFEGGRHERRLRKIEAIERGEEPSNVSESSAAN